MFIKLFSIYVIFFTFLSFSLSKNIVIGVYQSFNIRTPKTTQVNVQGGKYIRLQDFTKFLKITGKKKGVSYIQVKNKNFVVNVLSANDYKNYQLIKNKIKFFWGPKLNIINGEIAITGKIHRFSDWLDISKLSGDINYIFKAKIDADLHIKIKKYLTKLCKSNFIPCPNIQLKPYPKLTAPKKTKKYLKQWTSIFKKFGLSIFFTSSVLDLEPNIHIQVLIAEVNKNFQKQIGLKWGSSVQAQLLPSFSINDSLPLALKMLQSSGEGQILAQPNLLVKSGSEAKFLAGGEFPIKTSGIKRQHTSWKHYGIILKIKAYRGYNNKIENHLSVEISDIDNSNTVDGIPSIKKSHISSIINTTNNNYIALSGLLKHNSGQDTDSLPWLSKLPVLGNLFKSSNFKNSKTELVIFFKSTIKQ
ncbi:MAG: type II and III secretion system protein [Bdellovibrionales bacterium]|nr:type II and III secretion system protein [Bdellovibrionales bacterium]